MNAVDFIKLVLKGFLVCKLLFFIGTHLIRTANKIIQISVSSAMMVPESVFARYIYFSFHIFVEKISKLFFVSSTSSDMPKSL
jgi:hypothetical protein